jgi:hypothetical protein
VTPLSAKPILTSKDALSQRRVLGSIDRFRSLQDIVSASHTCRAHTRCAGGPRDGWAVYERWCQGSSRGIDGSMFHHLDRVLRTSCLVGIVQLFVSHHHLRNLAPTVCPANFGAAFMYRHPATMSVHPRPCKRGIRTCTRLAMHSDQLCILPRRLQVCFLPDLLL